MSRRSDTLHFGKPYRVVVHIEEGEGPRGGRYWALTLECGHVAFRRIPNPNPIRLVIPLLVHMSKKHRLPTLIAPYKVKCFYCHQETT